MLSIMDLGEGADHTVFLMQLMHVEWLSTSKKPKTVWKL